MNIGERVSVEFTGKIVEMRGADGFTVEIEPGVRVYYVPAGACTPIGMAEEIPLVAPDGSY